MRARARLSIYHSLLYLRRNAAPIFLVGMRTALEISFIFYPYTYQLQIHFVLVLSWPEVLTASN